MKVRITRLVCAAFMLISLFAALLPATVFAQIGEGGSTEVVARIEPVSSAASDTDDKTDSDRPESGGDPSDGSSGSSSAPGSSAPSQRPGFYPSSPVKTGVTIAWFVVSAFFLSGGLIVIIIKLKE